MLVIRLFRAGKRNQPFFKVVVTDKKNPPKGGRPVEILGFYDPLTKTEKSFNKERVLYWLSVGAKPSDTVYNLLLKEGILKGKKIPSHKKSKKSKEEKSEQPTGTKKTSETVKQEVSEKKVQEKSAIKEKPAEK